MLPAPTVRLRFREMVETDLPLIARLDIGGTASPEGWIRWNRQSYVRHGFGLWVTETLAGEFIGDCGLTMQDVEGESLVEVGWHVHAALRRQGYAAEAAEAVRAAAESLGVSHLIAIIRPDNVASQGVATKIGLEFEREVHKNGGPALIFGTSLNPTGTIR